LAESSASNPFGVQPLDADVFLSVLLVLGKQIIDMLSINFKLRRNFLLTLRAVEANFNRGIELLKNRFSARGEGVQFFVREIDARLGHAKITLMATTISAMPRHQPLNKAMSLIVSFSWKPNS